MVTRRDISFVRLKSRKMSTRQCFYVILWILLRTPTACRVGRVLSGLYVSGCFFRVCLKIEIHEVHKMDEIHLPKHRNPQHLGLYQIHCLKS